MCRSVRQTPHAWTSSSTCPGPGSGSGSCASRNGVRGASKTIARIETSIAVHPPRHDAVMAERCRRGLWRRVFARRRTDAEPAPPLPPAIPAPPGRPGAPSAAADEADDAELDELRGELVRELDRMARRQ